jgi:ribulose-5-phosphate 4-epimerase/fuculose-1-phosphate aldolase
MHVHMHVIPRFSGDCKDPRGGVRWVLPETAAYWRRSEDRGRAALTARSLQGHHAGRGTDQQLQGIAMKATPAKTSEKDVRVDVSSQVSADEWQQRVDLAACYRLVADFGWDDLIFTHISARVPGPEHHFLINPYGMMFDEITASSLVKVNLQGEKVMDSPYEINPAGFTIHSAVHEAREDAMCVLHVHSINGVAVSAQKDGVLPISQQSTLVLSSLGYHDYEGLALNPEEKPRLVADLGTNTFLMLRNHGLLTVADNVPDAFLAMYTFEATCMIQVRAMAAGCDLIPVDPRIIAGVKEKVRQVTGSLGGKLAWPALLRKLDRIDPGFRR